MKTPPSEADRATRGAKRILVLEEAAKALNRRGVSQTSLAEIAQGVGVSRAALYYYFEDQQDLVFQCYRRTCEALARRFSVALHAGGDAMAVIDAFLEGMLDGAEPEQASLNEAAYLRPEQRATIQGLYEAILTSIAEHLDAGARRGELRPCNARIVAQSIIGLICWLPMARRWRSSDPLSDRDMIDGVKALLRQGVAADRSAPPAYVARPLVAPTLPVLKVFDAEAMADARQEALLAAASWLFNLKGVDATPLEEIALRLGVTKKVIYHNVGDKETLVAACYRRAFKLYEANRARSLDQPGPRIESICAGIHGSTAACMREDITPLAPLAGFEALPEATREEIQTSAVRLMNDYLELYAQAEADGSLRAFEHRQILAVMPGTFEWLPKWFEVLRPADLEAAPAETALLVRIGLSPL